ncbi:helix-turn-helix domain-containing protein [Streptococcus equinus]|uniref:helix-turn-helix domain-containing protein n=1 Tax=Streptococcus equinus TaxID=1335 RepID=UPI0008886C13|nr:helix-turn-helix transcriptional regulator [Streptococcus equinus]SDI76434.1 HTH-type transcriptional regulator / antitoxin PezA [Streptococcus equinus]SEP81359.1 HTH-type transcriptional regulator / antitoxin PezA [Streptococcus equinus]
MIGENIKNLRLSFGLTQPGFAEVIGISRNSLSRYENGTSNVSTELVDQICRSFNVSYLDIIGKEKLLSPIEDYQLTLKIEATKERGASLLALFYQFQDESGIDFSDNTNPWIIMSDDLSDLINTRLYLIQTFDELERCNGYLDGLKRMLHVATRGVIM